MVKSGRLTEKETVFSVEGQEKLIITRQSDKCYNMLEHWVLCEHKEGAPHPALGIEQAS